MSSRKISSIVSPQEGWVAKFKQEDGTIVRNPVMVWAVVQDEKGEGNSLTSFSGPSGPVDSPGDTYIEPDNEMSNFIGWERLGYDAAASAATNAELMLSHLMAQSPILSKPVFPTLNVTPKARRRIERRFKGTRLSEFVQFSADDILSWRNTGARTVEEIRSELKKLGLHLRGDRPCSDIKQ